MHIKQTHLKDVVVIVCTAIAGSKAICQSAEILQTTFGAFANVKLKLIVVVPLDNVAVPQSICIGPLVRVPGPPTTIPVAFTLPLTSNAFM